jgi:hypothetical protein
MMEGMGLNLWEDKLARAVIVLAISLSEVIKDALKLQALHQMKHNGMSEEDIERWRGVLMDLDAALDQIRGDDSVSRALHQLGHGFNILVDHTLSTALNPDSFKLEIPEDGDGNTAVRTEPNQREAYINPRDIDEIARQVDGQSSRMLWYVWGHRHAKLDELKKISGETSHVKVLLKIKEMINPAARRLLGKPVIVFERSALDYYTGEHILYSWWLNE